MCLGVLVGRDIQGIFGVSRSAGPVDKIKAFWVYTYIGYTVPELIPRFD